MRDYAASIAIDAPVDEVWHVLADVSSWPQWTPTMLGVAPDDAKPLYLGSKVRVHQPQLRPSTWTVTEWHPGHAFAWVSRHPGVLVTAEHRLRPTATGCTAHRRLRLTGLLSPLVALRRGPLFAQFQQTELEILKDYCEAIHRSTRLSAVA